ncbi:MAG: TMEM43 family protein [Lentisphaeria bacterium]|nr:TMEM43 family protein [Lentisphaeria bacterium]
MSQFQTTSSQSWLSRLGGAFKGVLIGLVLFIIGFPVLWNNEHNAVLNTNALNELTKVTIDVGTPEIKQENEGKPVFMTGPAKTADILSDPDFGISENAVRLEREVEIYQFIEQQKSETKKKMGGGTETVTTYYYERAWVQNPIDSNSFADPNAKGNYRNVGAMKYQDNDLQAQSVSFGAFRFGPEIISKIGGRETYRFAQDFQLPPQMKALGARIEGEYVIIPFTPPAQNAATAIGQAVDALAGKADPNAAGKADPNAAGKADPNAAGKADPNAAGQAVGQVVAQAVAPQAAAPQIGDLRVRFTIVKPHDVSLIAVQKGDTFTDYVAKNGKKQFLFRDGTHTAADLFAAKAASNKMTRWLFRLLGFVLMYIGMSMVFKPLSVLADVIPFLGTIVGKGTSFVAFIIAAIFSLITIAIAWIAYRPIISITLLVLAGVCVFLFISKKKTAATTAA